MFLISFFDILRDKGEFKKSPARESGTFFNFSLFECYLFNIQRLYINISYMCRNGNLCHIRMPKTILST